MEVVRKLRFRVVRLSALLTGILVLLSFLFHPALERGIALGGLAGCASFWVWTRSAEKMDVDNRGSAYAIVIALVLRMAIYVLVLVAAAKVETGSFWGVAGAAAGLLIPNAVVAACSISDAKSGSGNG